MQTRTVESESGILTAEEGSFSVIQCDISSEKAKE